MYGVALVWFDTFVDVVAIVPYDVASGVYTTVVAKPNVTDD